ncbi:MAG: N-acetylneuraminate synthase [Pelagibacteraceae bacterium]|nr:N-acetylneuraminate synthase [Pelagibacteraceae bacterium]|tara:strand:- start:74282 stop:75352 length:1071 start_codon:yes stop_codon:yes gene_type:complete
MNEQSIKIGGTSISSKSNTYFIADIAANWDGSLDRAKKLIELCAKAGANAAKFQNFKASTIVSKYGFDNLGNVAHQAKWKKSVYEVYKDASLPIEWTKELKEVCAESGIDYFTTPYDIDDVDILSKYVAAWKIGSGDITWHELVEKLSKDNKPLIIATGASNFNEVEMAMQIAKKNNNNVVLMQCNTNYTGSIDNFKYINLNVLNLYKQKFPNTILGLSDHTPGDTTVLGAVALGAKVIEKHFTDDNNREGPDHQFSMTPSTWKNMVLKTRELELALGYENKKIEENEKESVIVQRRAIRAFKDLSKDHVISYDDLIVLRPISEKGLAPYKIQDVIGKKVKKNIVEGEEINFENIE